MGTGQSQGPGRQRLRPQEGDPPGGHCSGSADPCWVIIVELKPGAAGIPSKPEDTLWSQTQGGVCSPCFHISAAKVVGWSEFAGFPSFLHCVLEQGMEDSIEPDLSLQGHGPPHSASPWPTELESPLVCRALPGWALRGMGVYVNYPGAAGPHWLSSYHRCSCSAKQTLGGREGGKSRAGQALSTHAARTQHGEKQPHQEEEMMTPMAQFFSSKSHVLLSAREAWQPPQSLAQIKSAF